MVRDEFGYWSAKPGREIFDDNQSFEDSVQLLGSQIKLVDDDFTVDTCVSLIPTPGHTPAHVSVIVKDGEDKRQDQIIFTGDLFHHPMQIFHPEIVSDSDYDADQVIETRKRFLEEYQGRDIWGQHFIEPIKI